MCKYFKGDYITECVNENTVAAYLSTGSYLGDCNNLLITSTNSKAIPDLKTVKSLMEKTVKGFTIYVSPNPTASAFNLRFKSNSNELISIRILDVLGKEIQRFTRIERNQTIVFGNAYIAGSYFAEIIQGINRKVIKVAKLN